MKSKIAFISLVFICISQTVLGQNATIQVVDSASLAPLENVLVQNETYSEVTNKKGETLIKSTATTYLISKDNYVPARLEIDSNQQRYVVKLVRINIKTKIIKKVIVNGGFDNNSFLNGVEEMGIYASKKSEVIILDSLTVNTSANTARQIYSKVPGLNIWENDGSGLQLGIGGRGLSPSRVSNFNTRQNGYDISADALGYPESYYTPPAEMVEQIQIVRGAASLQFGTQFGGMLNFKLKSGSLTKKVELETNHTLGSYGFFNSSTSVGGTYKKLNYFSFYQYKHSDGYRKNAGLDAQTTFHSVNYHVSKKLKINASYTGMSYLAKQPGGLTDVQFQQNPRQSLRDRNWFKVNWNIFSVSADYTLTPKTKINLRNFGLVGSRFALGNLQPVNRQDAMLNRNLLKDKYTNFGSELRFMNRGQVLKKDAVFLLGARYYKGLTDRKQGEGSDRSDANFNYNQPNNLEGSDYDLPSQNIALFSENIIYLNPKLSLIPGLRFEHITTAANGYYRNTFKDFAGNIVYDERIEEQKESVRHFVLAGLGLSYKRQQQEFFLSWSQNYRAVNFNDLRVINPSFRVDPNLADEKGFTADAGVRGVWKEKITYDFSAFLLAYNNRIGSVLRADTQTFTTYRYRTNIAQSFNKGLELFAETDVFDLLNISKKHQLNWFVNTSLVDARYINSNEPTFTGKKVELVPSMIIRSGLTYVYKKWRVSTQYSYTSEQFTEATNTLQIPTGIDGLIPSYQIWDATAKYEYKKLRFGFSVNNLLNTQYFTRRATGYPGPGILSSDGRAFFVSLGVRI